MRKRQQKGYFVALNKENNTVKIATTKTAIADFLNIHYITVYRHLSKTSIYNCNEYTIWKNIPIQKITSRENNLLRYKEH